MCILFCYRGKNVIIPYFVHKDEHAITLYWENFSNTYKMIEMFISIIIHVAFKHAGFELEIMRIVIA